MVKLSRGRLPAQSISAPAMSETETTEKNDAPATATANDNRAVRVRHRFIGALCILAVAVLLWELGDDVPPPDFSDTQTPASQFPKKDFVQIQTAPPPSQIQNIPAPTQPAQSAQSARPAAPDAAASPVADASAPLDSPADNNAATAAIAAPPATVSLALAPEPESESESQTESPPSENLVQVGAFQQAEGAEQLARWLRGDGFQVVIRKDNDGFHRVLSSADPEHLAALGYISENAEAKTDSEPSPAAQPGAESEPTPSSPASPFVVQLGAFSNEKRARQMAAELRAQKFPARIEPVQRGGETLFRVRVVGLADRDSAEAMRRRLAEMGHAAAQTMDTR